MSTNSITFTDVYAMCGPGATETTRIERKASTLFNPKSKATREELAKQVCAFSNAEGGVLVFGFDNDGNPDEGIPSTVGRQPVTEWFEQQLPQLVHPLVQNCEAMHLRDPQFHADGYGALAIRIPMSDSRPHWVSCTNPEVPYLRVGAHSLPMSLQTLRDLASRTTMGAVHIEDIDHWTVKLQDDHLWLNPKVRLEGGSASAEWLVLLVHNADGGIFVSEFAKNAIDSFDQQILLKPYIPLFPGASIFVGQGEFALASTQLEQLSGSITMNVFCRGASPAQQHFNIHDLLSIAKKNDSKARTQETVRIINHRCLPNGRP